MSQNSTWDKTGRRPKNGQNFGWGKTLISLRGRPKKAKIQYGAKLDIFKVTNAVNAVSSLMIFDFTFLSTNTQNESKDQSRQCGRLFQTSEKPTLTENLTLRRRCTGHSTRRPTPQKGRGKRPHCSATQQITPST